MVELVYNLTLIPIRGLGGTFSRSQVLPAVRAVAVQMIVIGGNNIDNDPHDQPSANHGVSRAPCWPLGGDEEQGAPSKIRSKAVVDDILGPIV